MFLTVKQHRSRAGFTIIEMAVVLVVLGLIIGTIAPLLVSQIKQDKVREARDTVRLARDEIIGFARSKSSLPNRAEFSTSIGHTIDPWNQEIFYLPAESTTNGTGLCSTPSHDGFDLDSAGKSVSGVAFIVGSKGENYDSNTYLGSKKIDSADSSDDAIIIIKNYGQDDPAGKKYDDIVEFVTIDYIRERVCP